MFLNVFTGWKFDSLFYHTDLSSLIRDGTVMEEEEERRGSSSGSSTCVVGTTTQGLDSSTPQKGKVAY